MMVESDTTNHKITYLYKPDSRFATAFMDTRYRSRAVRGECIQDKATGEIYLRRAVDGRIISFNQNYKEVSQLMGELKSLELTNRDFIHPTQANKTGDLNTIAPNSIVVAENFDFASSNAEMMFNILGNDTYKPIEKPIKFKLSPKSNGFFMNIRTRISDIAGIEALSRNIDGSVIDKNAVSTFIAEIEVNNVLYRYSVEIPLRLNNMTAVVFPFIGTVPGTKVVKVDETDTPIGDVTNILQDIQTAIGTGTLEATFDKITQTIVTLKSIDFSDIYTRYTNIKASDDTELKNSCFKHLYPATTTDAPHEIFLTHMTILSYLDDMGNIIYNGNEFIVAALDLASADRWANVANKGEPIPAVVTSVIRPEHWDTNTLWIERIVDINPKTGEYVKTAAESKLDNLARVLAGYKIIKKDPIATPDSVVLPNVSK